MKKLLSILLVLTLAMEVAVFVGATPEPSLKEVTSIEAVWNEIAPPIYLYNLEPEFWHEHVTVTLRYADGTSKTLTEWYEEGNGWQWYLRSGYDPKTSTATFYYIDSNMERSYWDSIGRDYRKYVEADFLAGVPQTSFVFPIAILEQAIASQQITLKFNQPLVVLAEIETTVNRSRVFSFTPKKSGKYYFYTQKTQANPYALLRDTDFNQLGVSYDNIGNNFCLPARLKAGKTYYLFVGALNGYGDMTFELVVSDKAPRMNKDQWIVHYLLGGWILANPWYYSGKSDFSSSFGLFMVNYNAYVSGINLSYRRYQNALDTRENMDSTLNDLIWHIKNWPQITHGDG